MATVCSATMRSNVKCTKHTILLNRFCNNHLNHGKFIVNPRPGVCVAITSTSLPCVHPKAVLLQTCNIHKNFPINTAPELRNYNLVEVNYNDLIDDVVGVFDTDSESDNEPEEQPNNNNNVEEPLNGDGNEPVEIETQRVLYNEAMERLQNKIYENKMETIMLTIEMVLYTQPKENEIDRDDSCSICLDPFKELEIRKLVKLPGCAHIYCKVCIGSLLYQSVFNPVHADTVINCPQCRARIV